MKVDFISDVTCPWCAIGLTNLERAIARLGREVRVELRLQPFELNPDIPPEGEDIEHYAARKHGATRGDLAARQVLIRERAAEVGLRFGVRTRVFNTFNAHRLLIWAGGAGRRRQRQLKHALLDAYHVRGENPGSPVVLLKAATDVELDARDARRVLTSDAYADEVRARVTHWQALGIDSVPSVVIADRYLLKGGRSAGYYERALRDAANPDTGVATPA